MRIAEAYTNKKLVAILLSETDIRAFSRGEELRTPPTVEGLVFQLFHANPTSWFTYCMRHDPMTYYMQIGKRARGLHELMANKTPIAIIDMSRSDPRFVGYALLGREKD